MTTATDEDRRHVAGLVSQARVAMLTTTTVDGKRVSRPMGLQEAEFDGDLWFFADEDSAEVGQIRADPEVDVAFSDAKNSAWTSIAGRAEVVHDRGRAEALCTPTLKAWFPDGLDTPGLTLIRVRADSAEHWEGPSTTVGWVIGTARAAVTRDPSKDPITDDAVQL